MFSFRQKIFMSYAAVFLIFILFMFPLISRWVNHIAIHSMEDRALEIISNIKDAPNNEALIRRLKDQKSLIFFRISVITNEQKVLYDSHTKRLLGPKFSQEYVTDHPEVLQAFQEGVGYHAEYSNLLNQKFSYFAKSFNFHGKQYVLRTAFPYRYVTDISHDLVMGFLGLSAFILLLFSLMNWFIIHQLTKPIQKIINAVKPYQEGEQTTLPEINIGIASQRDEFGKLAYTLNSLSAKIQNHIDSLIHERDEKEAILESLVEGVVAVDHSMTVNYMNQTALKFLQLKREDLLNASFKGLNQKKCEQLLEECQSEKKPLTDTLEILINNQKFYLDIVAAPKRESGGAILVLQDKTAHYKIFEMRRDFIANASHELKTPITIIKGFAEALHDNPGLPRDVQLEVTSKIVRNCTRMTALIKDLLTLADIENIPNSRLYECNLNDLLQRCGSMLFEIFPDTAFTIHQEDEQEVCLIADADLLELAFMNLIENAAKYSNRPAKIDVVLNQTPEQITIQIKDKGIGIPDIDIEHIFDRFYTVDKAHSQKMGGSGLGLSIVKTIIEKHFGTIQLQSKLGEGSVFTIVLPKRDLIEI